MARSWRPARRLFFGVFHVFLTLLALQTLLVQATPIVRWEGPREAEQVVVALLSRHLLGVTPSGSVKVPDSQSSFYLLLWMFVTAAVLGAVWSSRARTDDSRRLHDHVRTLVRYAIASVMLEYGLNKLYLSHQFPFPSPSALVETYADSSPNALAWRFMGASPVYSMCCGVVETLGALLLCWRRTTTVGALILAGVMTNIVLLNFCYGIGVKLLAMELLAMAVFLAAPQAADLLAFLVLQRPLPAAEAFRPFPWPPRWERARQVGKAVLLGGFALVMIRREVGIEARHGVSAPRPTLWGVYDVEEFRRDGQPVPLVAGASTVWQEVGFGRDNDAPDVCIVTLDGVRRMYVTVYDEGRSTVSLEDSEHGADSFAVTKPDATHVELTGRYLGKPVAVRLRWRDMSNTRLLTSRFRWVQDQNGNL